MKRVPLALIVALITECFGPSSSAASSIDTELIAIEQRWNDAFLRKDAGVLSEVLADDFVIVYGNGDRGNKQSEISGLTSSDETIESSTLSDFDVRVYGDTAVVLSTVSAKGIRHGKPLNAKFRYMNVYVRRNGNWRCVASQNTRVGEIH
jgi:uncharacterized protein (TIGR02246 family)